MDELLHLPRLGPIACERPEIAVNLHGAGPQSVDALISTRPTRLISHSHPSRPWITGPVWREETHEVNRWCALLDWHGVPADPQELALIPPPPWRSAGHVVIHPGAAYAARRWPAERFAEVATALHARYGTAILITGSSTEHHIGSSVADLAGLPRQCVMAGLTDLTTLAAIVGSASLVICGDTGVAHLASALGVPSVVLFGPVSPSRWGPPPGGPHRALWAGKQGDPHGKYIDEGLLRIDVEEVMAAASELMEPRCTALPRERRRRTSSGINRPA
ncbi:glycosyltransferase family 9 protein [Sinosporangium siamense]|uniref:glycosyltransferase family 9 protein n=1 Tax=Sinosporangium siamense TaxID=1367973 RepID=UPI0035E8D896